MQRPYLIGRWRAGRDEPRPADEASDPLVADGASPVPRPALVDVDGVPFERYGGALVCAAPPHVRATVSDRAAARALWQTRSALLRYTSDWDLPHETGFWFLVRDRLTEVGQAKASQRRKFARSLELFESMRVDRDAFVDDAYDVYAESVAGYGELPMSAADWRASVLGRAETKDFWITRERASGRPAAYLIALRDGDTVAHSAIKVRPTFRRHNVTYGLFQTADRHYLVERGLRYVSAGARSLAHDTRIQSFLIDAGYRRAYCRLHVHVHPLLRPVAPLVAALGRTAPALLPARVRLVGTHWDLRAREGRADRPAPADDADPAPRERLLPRAYRRATGRHAPSAWHEAPALLVWKPVRRFLIVVAIPCVPFDALRVALYRLVGFRIGRRVSIGMRCLLDDADPRRTVIEDGATIAHGVQFACHGPGQGRNLIHVREGAYVGLHATVLGGRYGVVIGRNAVVGAAALVVASVDPETTVGGVPARPLGRA